jgi:hypothetical protein
MQFFLFCSVEINDINDNVAFGPSVSVLTHGLTNYHYIPTHKLYFCKM